MTKTELSRRLGELPQPRPMSLDVITKLEAGTRAADVDDLDALAGVFGVRPGSLLVADGEASVNDEIRAFVAERVPDRPYFVEVHGRTDGIDTVAMYVGEEAVQMRNDSIRYVDPGADDGRR